MKRDTMIDRARNIALAVALVVSAIIVVATLSPLQMRPTSELPTSLERELAFMLLGCALTFALPKRALLLLALLVACAGTLEWLQTMVPTRHARLDDFIVKSLGVTIGAAIGALANRWVERADRASK